MWKHVEIARSAWSAIPRARGLRPGSRRTVADRIEELAQHQPERDFLLFEEGGALRRLGYGEWNARANRVAWWAMHRGLRRGDVVALLMENRPAYVTVWAGLAKAGVTTALLNTNLTGSALAHALEAAGARILVLGGECHERLASLPPDPERQLETWLLRDPDAAEPIEPRGSLRDLDAALAERGEGDPDPSVRDDLRAGDDLFYIYTSGTTGLPKAARFSHLRFLGIGIASAISMRMTPDDVHYCALPLYHSAGGAMMVSTCLEAGASLALRRRFSARAFWDDCRRFGATRFQYIGEFCRYLLNQPPRADDRDHGVRIVMGNGLRPDIWETFQERFGIEEIIEFYGATEGNATLVNVGGRVGSVGRIPFGPLGRRLGNIRLIRYDVERDEPVRDENGRCIECGPDEPGEFVARINETGSLGRFEGYTSAEATRKKILRDAFEPGDAWFRSGDLLRRDRQGWFYFVDRIGDTFRWKGENVSTEEVAAILGGFPGLEMVNVYGVAIEGHEGRAGMAALLPVPGEPFDARAFHAFVTEKLPPYAAPLFVRILSEPDVTGTLKQRKVRLQQEGFDPDATTDAILFRDDEAATYVPVTRPLFKDLHSGTTRL